MNRNELIKLMAVLDVANLSMRNSVKAWVLIISVLLTPGISIAQNAVTSKNLKLWYNHPAKNWNEALPVGNGRLGAMVFGDHQRERIQLNEESLWSGSKIDANVTVSPGTLREFQQMVLDGEIVGANEFANKNMMSKPGQMRSYQPLGNFFIDYSIFEWLIPSPENYRRELDLKTGIAKTVFTRIDQTITEEVFASAPDNVIVIRISTDKPGKLALKACLGRIQDATFIANSSNQIRMSGRVVDPPSFASGSAGIHMAFEGLVTGFTDGTMQTYNNSFLVENGSTVTFYLTAATDYNLEKLDFDRSKNPENTCKKILENVTENSYTLILERHLKEYGSLFNRVDLNLGGQNMDSIPTDQRLENLRKGANDLDLISLYFQYGRYLLMSSSRAPGILPANLQGIWNQDYEAPWDADYHTNINIEMNYWPAEVCNLSETLLPYTNFFHLLRVPGRVSAKKMYNSKGWVLHLATDPFGRTSIIDAVDVGACPIATAWLVLELWEHYRFTGDKEYLNTKAYPAMKEAAEFFLDFLIKDKNGNWVTVPSNSPENKYFLPNGSGQKSMLTYSSTYDIEQLNELFNNIQSAGTILGVDKEFIQKLKSVQQNLPPIKVSKKYNTIQEWIQDFDETEPEHRHFSPLFGLYPGNSITKETPVLANAAINTLNRRLASKGDRPGWSWAWIINLYARLAKGDQANDAIEKLLQHSTQNNLLNNDPFQIDGNFGATAGIAEMLLQSQGNTIDLLPALPETWKEGEVLGLKARGNFEISMFWANNKLNKVIIKSLNNNACTLKSGVKTLKLNMKNNQILVFNGGLKPVL
ncbi:MAG: glycoside hydrolase family 95 protein [Bacteroidota bacterium]